MPTILIVDDSETVRVQLGNDLIAAGYSTLEASNGLEGLRILNKHPNEIDLIFCDVNMPEMDGLSMCRELHKDAMFNTIPVFMLTTQNSVDMKAEGKECGVVAWIVKPYKKETVLGGIAKILARR